MFDFPEHLLWVYFVHEAKIMELKISLCLFVLFIHEIMNFIETLPVEAEVEDEEDEIEFKWDTYHRNTIEAHDDLDDDLDDDDWDEDDYDVEVEYRK